MIESRIKQQATLKRYRRFKRHKLAVVSVFVILLSILVSVTAELWANNKPIVFQVRGTLYFPMLKNYPAQEFGIEDALVVNYRDLDLSGPNDWSIWPLIRWGPNESNMDVTSYPSPPDETNWLGTDDRGRDVLTRLIYGLRYSLIYAVSVWLLSVFLGVIAGGIMGQAGGKTDFLGQRGVETINMIPQFFILLLLIATYRPTLPMLIAISSVFGWTMMSYYMRGEFLKNRKMEYVDAAYSVGASKTRIFAKHLLPNSLAPIITLSPFIIAGNVTGLASLDYLGFGLVPPTPSWGELLNQAKNYFTIAWWLAFFPSAALFGLLFSLAGVGEGVRDAMDPHL